MKISVLTASYNYENYISETIESVLNQTYKDFEYIIFDDGSTDKSLEIIEKYAQKDSRIKIYSHPDKKNHGLIQTLKEGIEKCNGDYIVFIENDDIIQPFYLEEKIKIAKKHPDAAVIYNNIIPFGDNERVSKTIKHLKTCAKLVNKEQFDYKELLGINIIPTFSCVMAKKEVLKTIDFSFPIEKCFDWYLWNNIIQNYKIVYFDKPLTKFRLHNKSMSCKKNKKSVYCALLSLSQRRYNNKFLYKIFESYKSLSRIEKIFRPICVKLDNWIYKRLYLPKTISVIKES